ncbi:MAG: hypothetical protein HW416_268 [Chloroflexi bacterium]|nr:hypothetical protein [Chloroflexota bacterium]
MPPVVLHPSGLGLDDIVMVIMLLVAIGAGLVGLSIAQRRIDEDDPEPADEDACDPHE